MEIPILFGRFLVREYNIPEDALRETINVQSEINWSFSATALMTGLITLEDFKNALDYQRQKGTRFRDALAELKIADDETIRKIEAAHKERSAKLGELLVKKGILTDEDMNRALIKFKERDFLVL
ncbi:MAG: hypothetical protein HZA16_13840 [Nitrospirae bacterium]|nr:hypothetical protein [Nitrospirota bacterium]